MSLGPNVVEVVPSPPSAGFVDASFAGDQVDHVLGASSGEVFLEIVDPQMVRDAHTYQITFDDTLFLNQQGLAGYDTATTKSYYLVDITNENNPDTLINNSFDLPESDADVIDGFRLTFKNVESLGFNRSLSSWNTDSVWTFDVARYYTFNVVGSMLPFDYRVIFTEGIPIPVWMCVCALFPMGTVILGFYKSVVP